jgi:peptidoglycan/LPS O-acetylase OafA/YrhL
VFIFLFVICNDQVKRILEFKPLVFIGGISYSVYVLHWLILAPHTQEIHNFVANRLSANVYISFAISLLIGVSIIIIAALLLDLLVDKPCIKFSSWFAKGLVREIQSKIASIKIITASSRYMATMLVNTKGKVHSLFTPAANTPDVTISRQPAAPIKVD